MKTISRNRIFSFAAAAMLCQANSAFATGIITGGNPVIPKKEVCIARLITLNKTSSGEIILKGISKKGWGKLSDSSDVLIALYINRFYRSYNVELFKEITKLSWRGKTLELTHVVTQIEHGSPRMPDAFLVGPKALIPKLIRLTLPNPLPFEMPSQDGVKRLPRSTVVVRVEVTPKTELTEIEPLPGMPKF